LTESAPGMTSERRLLHEGWPVVLLFGAFPLWWLLGLGGLIWPLLAMPMFLQLLRKESVEVPRGLGIWLLFLAWMMASLVQVDEPGSRIVAIHRASLYLSATILFVYVYNVSPSVVPRIFRGLAFFWAMVVIIGVVALLLPSWELRSPLEVVLPRSLAEVPYVHDLTHVRLSQVQDLFGSPVPRPAGPFTYTNEWGASFALLTLFTIPTMILKPRPWKWLVPFLALAAILPLVVSLNRGAWLSLGLGLAYATVRMALRGRMGAVSGMMISIVVVVGLVIATPLGGIFEDRLESQDSTTTRFQLYRYVLQEVEVSPLFGNGAPEKVDPRLPEIGTHGAFWLVLYSHGIPALLLFLAFPIMVFWRSRRARSPLRFWPHVVILIAIIQMPYYNLLATDIHILMVAAALSLRPDESIDHRMSAGEDRWSLGAGVSGSVVVRGSMG